MRAVINGFECRNFNIGYLEFIFIKKDKRIVCTSVDMIGERDQYPFDRLCSFECRLRINTVFITIENTLNSARETNADGS